MAFPSDVEIQWKRSEDGERRNILPFNSFSGLEAVSSDLHCDTSHRTSPSNCTNQYCALGYSVFYETWRSSRLPCPAGLSGSRSDIVSTPALGRWWDEGCLLLCVYLFLLRARSCCHCHCQQDGALCWRVVPGQSLLSWCLSFR